MRRTSSLIVGGGPAGAVAALALARAGARPLLLERSRGEQATVCGAFLGWDAVAGLGRMGIDPWALGARPIERLRIVSGTRIVERRLPARAAGLSRRLLDMTLLRAAEAAGAGIERGVTVRAVEDQRLTLSDGTELAADALFLATGKHALRGAPRSGTDGPGWVGLRTALPATPALDGWIELHLFAGGYGGLITQEDGSINLCLSVSAARLRAAGTPDALLAGLAGEAPRLLERTAGAALDWSAIAAVPYGWRTDTTSPGLFRLGDQAAVIASLAGDGIAIALASGRQAAEAFLSGGGAAAPAFQRSFARRARRPIAVAEVLRRAVERPRVAGALLLAAGVLPGGLQLAARATRIGY